MKNMSLRKNAGDRQNSIYGSNDMHENKETILGAFWLPKDLFEAYVKLLSRPIFIILTRRLLVKKGILSLYLS